MNKNPLSLLAFVVISALMLFYRVHYPTPESGQPMKLTTWDAYGYYLYLPSVFIYHDVRELAFQDSIDKKYDLSGGRLYQANRQFDSTGNYVFKYLGGVAIMHLPLFATAHAYCLLSNTYPADGFSLPYQYAIGYGIVLYLIIAVWLLRKLLLKFFNDDVTAITLLLLMLASNALQYISIDSAQSHAPIFLLYCIVLLLTHAWHEKPTLLKAFWLGWVIGLATISRPTEAIMVLIPILWNTHTLESAREKWKMVAALKPQVALAAMGGIIGILPQLLYWKYTSGSFIYDVGSSWRFLNPFFRVLFGFEKGWFIYTPVTIYFVLGMFFMKEQPFKKSVIWFCMLNIWIIISWSDWKYGGSYTTRALVQSYPVFALAFASFLQHVWNKRIKVLVILTGIYLIGVNLFQINQYNRTILHYYDMNRAYYSRIYLNPHVTPLDKSLMDNEDWVNDEEDYQVLQTLDNKDETPIPVYADSSNIIHSVNEFAAGTAYLRIDLLAKGNNLNGNIVSELQLPDTLKINSIRLNYPEAQTGQWNAYSFYVYVPDNTPIQSWHLRFKTNQTDTIMVKDMRIKMLARSK